MAFYYIFIMKKFIDFILVFSITFSGYKIFDYIYETRTSEKVYEEYRKEKKIIIEEKIQVPKIETKPIYNWIKIPNTNIDYPIVYGKGDDYYLIHDVAGNKSVSGSIFYGEYEEPMQGTNTSIYGHCMKNGTMFANLHLFKDENKFYNSRLILETETESHEYIPLAVYITNEDFFHLTLDNYTTYEALDIIKEKAMYYNDLQYSEDAHIITLMTCEYSAENNRLFVFYISE